MNCLRRAEVAVSESQPGHCALAEPRPTGRSSTPRFSRAWNSVSRRRPSASARSAGRSITRSTVH